MAGFVPLRIQYSGTDPIGFTEYQLSDDIDLQSTIRISNIEIPNTTVTIPVVEGEYLTDKQWQLDNLTKRNGEDHAYIQAEVTSYGELVFNDQTTTNVDKSHLKKAYNIYNDINSTVTATHVKIGEYFADVESIPMMKFIIGFKSDTEDLIYASEILVVYSPSSSTVEYQEYGIVKIGDVTVTVNFSYISGTNTLEVLASSTDDGIINIRRVN